MKLIFIILLFPMILLAESTNSKLDIIKLMEEQQQNLFKKVSPAVVFIITKNQFGSGFFISEDGLIVTNLHVIKNAKDITIVLNDGKKYSAKIQKKAKNNIDVALLKIDAKKVSFPFLNIENVKNRKIGAWVATIGHGSGAIWSFNTGIISNIYTEKSQKAIFQTQIPVSEGNSGGPVFDRKGNVLGILTAKLTNSNNINFAIDITKAMKELEMAIPKKRFPLVIKTLKSAPIFVDKKRIGLGAEIKTYLTEGSHEIMVILNGKIKKIKVNIPEKKEITIK